jgi:hypothetical protein
VADAGPAGATHYPDVQTLPPSETGIDYDQTTGRKLLRFTVSIANLGEGPLEVMPTNNATTDTTDAYQRLYTHDASGNWRIISSTYVGTFEFHPEHNHWHFDNFARYELRNVASDGSVGDTVLASNHKVSFCIRDDVLVSGSLAHAASSESYTNCNQTNPQGISVGWADVYPWSLPDQDVDITGIPDGDYWLIATADPDNLLNEGGGAAETNNAGAVKVHIASDLGWFDDGVPAGAITGAYNGDSWKWISSNPMPVSGRLAHQSAIKAGSHQHFFYGAGATLPVNANNTLFTYVYLDPANLPSEVMLQWSDGFDWEHRAYWGANRIPLGTDGTASRRSMGPLPPAAAWVRLEVPAGLVGLEGKTLSGMSFVLYNGRATWDYTGVNVASPSPAPPDTASPAVTITSPPNNATVSGSSVTVSASASDNVGVAGVQFKLDGANLGAEVTSAPYSIVWNSASTANGSHTLTAEARDAAGNQATSTPIIVTVSNGTPPDTAPPTVAITSPANNATVSGSSVTVSANASDNVGVAGVQFKLDGANLGAEVTSAPYNIIWNSTSTPNGTHTLTGLARDAAGNQTTSAAVTIVVSNSTSGSTVWFDDELPAGATPFSDGGDAWNWVSTNPAPFSGSQAHQSNLAPGLHEHYFNWAWESLTVNPNDILLAYVFLDSASPPSELMLIWNDGSWEHRAYWGANLIPYGQDGTVGRRYLGPLPPAGQWVRLEVPASAVGLEGRVVSGMAFTLFDGRATWDYAGKTSR